MTSSLTPSLRIAVTGLAATYPFGGVFWDYIQYALGFQRLGHEVLYIEDTGKWCYDPSAGTFVESGAHNAEYLACALKRLDAEQNSTLADRWFMRDATGATYGRSWQEVTDFCRSADLFLHISASCWMREEYFAKRVAFIDSDPLYTQAALLSGTVQEVQERITWWKSRHHAFFTFGENINQTDCRIPTDTFPWIPTRQPVVLECFRKFGVPVDQRRRVLTTVASWEPTEKGPVVEGVAYRGKSVEFERFMDLPSRSVLPLEVALSGPAPRERLQQHGWRLVDANAVSGDPWVYRAYLANSYGEWSVAKNAYVASRSGWFSCRTACYLALGVPAVVQDTGYEKYIPTDAGVLAFRTPAEASDAIGRLAANPQAHTLAAHEIAREYFDSDKVLNRLIDEAFSVVRGPSPEAE